jgi:hypothetical protein
MCLFSDFIEKVSDTQIFARGAAGRQVLVYSMRYAAGSDLAMVLPIPTPAGSPDGAVRFISLDACPDFFDHLKEGFPARHYGDIGDLSTGDVAVAAAPLVVHDVGAYEASFVPSPEDFGRLDERFRLPVEIWLELNHYRDWGFAVFKLKRTSLAAVHPMAFDFPRRDPRRLFFPTLHLHDRKLVRTAHYDHMLYCQAEPGLDWHLQEWEDSQATASEFVLCEAASRIVLPDQVCWRAPLEGALENRDTWVGSGSRLPSSATA